MDKLFDDLTRILATPMPRRRTLQLVAGAIGASVLSGVGLRQSEAAQGSFWAFSNAIDVHLWQFLRFTEPDPHKVSDIWQQYERAKDIRQTFHLTGEIPNDPLIELVTEGVNEFLVGTHRNVVVLLGSPPTLEGTEISFAKPAGAPGHFVLIGGNSGFWQDQQVDAKFASAAFTLPQEENFLTIASQSWGIGKVIVVIGAGAAGYAVAVKVRDRSRKTGQRCQCTFTCTAPDGATFPLTRTAACCDASEALGGACPGQCTAFTEPNGTRCAPTASTCIPDTTCI